MTQQDAQLTHHLGYLVFVETKTGPMFYTKDVLELVPPNPNHRLDTHPPKYANVDVALEIFVETGEFKPHNFGHPRVTDSPDGSIYVRIPGTAKIVTAQLKMVGTRHRPITFSFMGMNLGTHGQPHN